MSAKYIFVTGGVVSGLGKGITAASLGRLLKARGLRVIIQKFDPYINVDPGTMSPYQHGEVFVTDDGGEADLDLGHYERFIDENLTKDCSITTGRIYWSIITKERKGDFLGGTVQVVPHVTNEIKEKIYKVGKETNVDVVITEVGGTVGDIESLPFLEAIRQVKTDVGQENVAYVHVTLVPYLGNTGELKTKPTQHSVKELRSIGIQPDFIVCRSEKTVNKELRDKIGLFCNIEGKYVIENCDVESIYEVPVILEKQGLAQLICEKFGLNCSEPDLSSWTDMVSRQKNLTKKVNISLVGKYVELHDAYISVVESLKAAGIANDAKVQINWVNSENVNEENVKNILSDAQGILVPGGFGDRGIEGKILAAKYARENNIPYLGLCLGMQLAVVEIARNVLGLTDANSTEFNPKTQNPVIDIMHEQKNIDKKGGTMRLGLYPCKIEKNTNIYSAYGEELINERHRHRYEFNNEYKDALKQNGLICSGVSPDGRLVEAIELQNHKWFVAVQFHPEFKSRPNKPHPLFREFIKASLE